MGGEKVKVDDAESIRRFVSQMRIPSNSSHGLNASSTSTPSRSPSEQRNGTAPSNSPEKTNGSADHVTQPVDIPSPEESSHDSTPSRNSPASPITSPHARGILAPNNTPKTNPASPFVGPIQTHDEDVGYALADFVKTMEGKPLSQSMWAPNPGSYEHSLLSGARVRSRDLTSTKVIDANPAIDDSFARMSFKAADSDDKVGNNLTVERNASASSPNGVEGQPTTALSTTQKLEADLVPMSDRGSVKAPHSAAKHYTLADDEDGTISPAVPSARSKADAKEPTPTKPIEKETLTPPKAVSVVPPHLRGGHTPQSFTDKAKDLVSQMFTTASEVSHPDALETTLTSPPASHPTTPSSKGPGEKTADVASPAQPPTTPVQVGLVSTLKALELSGSLGPEEQALLKELTERVLSRSISQHTMTATPAEKAASPAETPAEPSLPSDFLSKWVTKPKESSQTSSDVSPKATEASSPSPSKDTAPTGSVSGDFDAARESLKSTAGPLGVSKVVLAKSGEDLEDREHKTYFNNWPKLEQRDRPAAQIRKVIIKSLPANATPSFVASLVYFGSLEEIHMREGSATVRFLDAADCNKFYGDAANGIVYGKDIPNRERFVLVELAKDVDVIGGLLRGWIDTGVTRCVRAVGVDEDWSMDALCKIGENKDRKIESIQDGKTPGSARSVVWRFCKIDEAVQFKAALSRNEKWEHCNIHHAADPCATATGVHFEK